MADVYWDTAKVKEINKGKYGIGGAFELSGGKIIGCGCFNSFPQDAEIDKEYRVFVSFGKILDVLDD